MIVDSMSYDEIMKLYWEDKAFVNHKMVTKMVTKMVMRVTRNHHKNHQK